MFKLNKRYEVNRKFLKCDYLRYSPSEISTKNTANSHIYIYILTYHERILLFLCQKVILI